MKKLLLALPLALAACASTTDVLPVGGKTFTVGAKMSGPGSGWTETKQMAYKRANEYCTAQGAEMRAGKLETHGVRGFSPLEAELTFECIEKQNQPIIDPAKTKK